MQELAVAAYAYTFDVFFGFHKNLKQLLIFLMLFFKESDD